MTNTLDKTPKLSRVGWLAAGALPLVLIYLTAIIIVGDASVPASTPPLFLIALCTGVALLSSVITIIIASLQRQKSDSSQNPSD